MGDPPNRERLPFVGLLVGNGLLMALVEAPTALTALVAL
jgi:hypothetical protein